MSTKAPIDPNKSIRHNCFTDANIVFRTSICSAPINDSGMLQTTQHGDAICVNVATVGFASQLPPSFYNSVITNLILDHGPT